MSTRAKQSNGQSDPTAPEPGPTNRSFGLTFSLIFALVAFAPVIAGGALVSWALACSVAMLLVSMVWPSALTHANRLWARFGALLHRIVSPVVLGLLFFAVIT